MHRREHGHEERFDSLLVELGDERAKELQDIDMLREEEEERKGKNSD